jgi:hypothetical protein
MMFSLSMEVVQTDLFSFTWKQKFVFIIFIVNNVMIWN